MSQESERTKIWDHRFLSMASLVASWSKDPSTKVGAVVVDPERRVCGVGYNGFPRGVYDDPAILEERAEKLSRVVHAEANALLSSSRTLGCTIYVWPLFSCSSCAGLIIQAGVTRVVTPPPIEERWRSSYGVASDMYKQAGVQVSHLG